MEQRTSIASRILVVLFLVALVLFPLTACTGDKGDKGSRGATGAPGTPGDPGIVPSEIVAKNLVLDLTKTVSYNSTTGKLTIHFFLTDEDDNPVDVTKDAYDFRIYVAELIPTIPGDYDNPGPAWDRLVYESGVPASGTLPGTLKLVDANTGEYTYTLSNTVHTTINVLRVVMYTRWQENINGTNYTLANPVNAHYDFYESAPGTRLLANTTDLAEMVTTSACESCHGEGGLATADHGRYTQTTTCNVCHNWNYMVLDRENAVPPLSPRPYADMAAMIHGIHGEKNFGLGDFSDVTYPQYSFTCTKCHIGQQADMAYSNPTRNNCGSCHDNIDFATGDGHDGGVQDDDSLCAGCHPATGVIDPPNVYPVETVHMPDPGDPWLNVPDSQYSVMNVPEFDVSISMTNSVDDSTYPPGYVFTSDDNDNVVVNVTLKDHITNTPISSAFYTTEAGAKGNTGDTALSGASLYIYGPRNEAIPVLATDTISDGAYVAPPTQGHALFVNGTDAQVETDATGFHYRLLGNIADLDAGTYMVRFEGGDYGGVATDDYVTSSVGLINFQVGTATVEKKVSGDACLNCHGETKMHLTGTHAHDNPFDTDYCLACHDKSGNHGDYIGNRVHAIHRATILGDYNDRDWSEVTFPRPANNCLTCHTDTTVDTPVWRMPNMLACGGCHGVMPDVDPFSYPVEQQDQVIREVGAAQHMQQNGGDAAADALGETPTLSCLICHGEGKVADLYDTHQLIKFRELPVDPN